MQAAKDLWDILVQYLYQWGSLELQGHLGQRESREMWVLEVLLVVQAHKVKTALLDLVDHLGKLVLLEAMELVDQWGMLAPEDQQGQKGPWVTEDP